VDEVLPKPFAFSTDATVSAVVYFLAAIVVPKLAYFTVVPRRLDAAVGTVSGSRLGGTARHAEHVFGLLPVQIVVLHGIVAMPAGVPTPTCVALHFDVAFVMLASERRAILGGIEVLILPTILEVRIRGTNSVGSGRVPRPQMERILRIDFRGC
jgi:hypothetical protein